MGNRMGLLRQPPTYQPSTNDPIQQKTKRESREALALVESPLILFRAGDGEQKAGMIGE